MSVLSAVTELLGEPATNKGDANTTHIWVGVIKSRALDVQRQFSEVELYHNTETGRYLIMLTVSNHKASIEENWNRYCELAKLGKKISLRGAEEMRTINSFLYGTIGMKAYKLTNGNVLVPVFGEDCYNFYEEVEFYDPKAD